MELKEMNRQLQAAKTFTVLASIITILLLLNCATLVYKFGFGASEYSFFFHVFNMEYEQNVPTIYSALQLLFAAFLLYGVFKDKLAQNDLFKWHWGLLCLAFVYLSFDEAIELHEKSMPYVERISKTTGPLFYGWIIPASICVFVMGLFYIRFLLALPVRSRNLFIISGIIYVGSAIGFEMIEGPMEQSGNWMTLPYATLVTIEETLEMLGIALFCYAVIDYENRLKNKA